MKNTTVAVWGSKCAGKTAFSAALSASLSRYFNSILLVSGDKFMPAFAAWGVPNDEKSKRTQSIADICAFPDINEDIIKKHFTVLPKNDKIGLVGYLTKDDCELYEPISGNAAQSFIDAARKVSQITVVDCTVPQTDRITEKALKEADTVIILFEPNAAGIGFVYSQNSFISHNLTDDRRYIYIAAKVTPESAVDEFETKLGLRMEMTLPYTPEAVSKLTNLELFKRYDGEYQKTADSVADIIKEGAVSD